MTPFSAVVTPSLELLALGFFFALSLALAYAFSFLLVLALALTVALDPAIGVGPCPAELELVAAVLILDRVGVRLTRSVVRAKVCSSGRVLISAGICDLMTACVIELEIASPNIA